MKHQALFSSRNKSEKKVKVSSAAILLGSYKRVKINAYPELKLVMRTGKTIQVEDKENLTFS